MEKSIHTFITGWAIFVRVGTVLAARAFKIELALARAVSIDAVRTLQRKKNVVMSLTTVMGKAIKLRELQ